MAEEEVVAVGATVEVAAEEETTSPVPVTTDLKRKLDDLESEDADAKTSSPGDLPKEELNSNSSDDVENSVPDAKKPRLEEEPDESALENGHEEQKQDVPAVENAGVTTATEVEAENVQDSTSGDAEAENPHIPSAVDVDAVDVKHVTVEDTQMENAENQSAEGPQEGDTQKSSDETPKIEDVQHPSGGDLQQPEPETQPMSRKMDVPNNKVGVLIGKGGDTIRFLQLNSGAKIQITRDGAADPSAPTRPMELIGSLEEINKAERLIKDVIAEADAGGSPSLVARGLGTVQAISGDADQIQIQVPNEKVGLIIGKGGETIKSLQSKSGARIQLIPQHLPEGDQSKERTVRVTGDKKRIEIARNMIKEVMSQPVRHSSHSGGYNHQGYRPRGPSGPHWGGRVPPNTQATGYENQQRGMYQSQNQQYMQPAYGGYPQQQSAPRGSFNAGWDQRAGPMQATPPQGGGYDYYAHGGHATDSSAHNPMSNSGPSGHGAPSTHVNYNNYGQPQGPEYGQPSYSQPPPAQQSYGYEDPKYANQVPTQAAYGGHGHAQAGAYPQQVATQSGYAQQPYSKPPPTYGMPSQGSAQQSYGPPRAGQPGDVPYQNPAYGQAVPSQQQYPYASGGPAHQAYPYNSAPPANDGYNQPQTHSAPAPVYPQQGGQAVPGYGQPGGQVAPVYAQGGQAAGYGPYPSQPGYGEQQAVANNAGYYQAPPEAGYSGAPTSAYGAPSTAQANYVQPTPNQPTYEQQQQPAPQSGAYASVPGGAPGYAKNVSPQPAVYGQYDSTQMYAGQH